MNYLVSGKMLVRAGMSSQTICPWQAFDCADMPLMLAVGTDQQFVRLCEVMELPELAKDARFVTNRKRMENKTALIPMLAERLKTRSARQWMEAFNAVGVASGPINDFGQVNKLAAGEHAGRDRARNQRLRQQAGVALLRERAVFAHAEARAAGRLGDTQVEPAELAHPPPHGAVEARFAIAQRADALEVVRRRDRARAVADQADALGAILEGLHRSSPARHVAGRRHAQRPLNTGARFSNTARAASRASSVCISLVL